MTANESTPKRRTEARKLAAVEGVGTATVVVPEIEATTETYLDRISNRILSGPAVLSLPPVRWIIPGWLPERATTMVYGPPGAGKSFYAVAMALELASGGSWCGHSFDAPVPVLYVAAERPYDLRDRAEAWSLHHRKPIPGAFHLLPVSTDSPQLTQPDRVGALCELVEAIGAKVVILDTYARLTLGIDENSAKDTGPVGEQMERIVAATGDGAVVAVHHSGKDVSRGMRGSNALEGNVSLTIRLTSDNGLVTAEVDKNNSAAKDGHRENYRIHGLDLPPEKGSDDVRDGGVLLPTMRPVASDKDREQVLEIIRNAFDGAASRNQIAAGLKEQHGREMGTSTIGRILTALKRDGILTTTGGGQNVRYVIADDAEGFDI